VFIVNEDKPSWVQSPLTLSNLSSFIFIPILGSPLPPIHPVSRCESFRSSSFSF
jgi:hypothetical protein